jgi:hypothetical protein
MTGNANFGVSGPAAKSFCRFGIGPKFKGQKVYWPKSTLIRTDGGNVMTSNHFKGGTFGHTQPSTHLRLQQHKHMNSTSNLLQYF